MNITQAINAQKSKQLLPKGIEHLKQFILYKLVPSTERPGKTDKKPCDTSGRLLKWSDKNTWLTGNDALIQSQLLGYGIGFILTPDDNFFFIDIDNCLQLNSQWSPISTTIMQKFAGAFMEISSSGQGIHIIGRGKIPAHKCRNNKLNIELYTESRFVALTMKEAIGDATKDFSAIIDEFVKEYFNETISTSPDNELTGLWDRWKKAIAEPPNPYHTSISDDNELINKMLTHITADNAFAGKASFADLWNNNEEILARNYSKANSDEYDPSAADAALIQRLAFWTGNDALRMEHLAKQSGLYREKYERSDYLPRTILKVRSKQTVFYNKNHYQPNQNESKSSNNNTQVSKSISLPDTPSVMPFDFSLLPNVLSEWVEDVVNRSQCPPDFVAISIVCVIAAIIGRKFSIYPKEHDDWVVTPNLWGCCIGKPSAMKTPAIKAALSFLEPFEKTAKHAHYSALTDFKAEKNIRKLKKSMIEKEIKKLLKDNKKEEAKKQSYEISAPLCPTEHRYTVNDSSVEKLGELLNENPNGLLLYRDELSGWLAKLQTEQGAPERAFYLEAYNGNGSFTYDRIGRGTIHINSCCVSIIGGLQPSRLTPIVRDSLSGTVDDGLIQRFQLAVWPEKNKHFKLVDRAPNKKAKERVQSIINSLNKLPQTDTKLHFTPEAQVQFSKWYETHMQNIYSDDNKHDVLQAKLIKLQKTIVSLALIFELIEGDGKSVGINAINRALKWVPYLESHWEKIYSSISRSAINAAKLIIDRRNKLNPTFTARQILQKGWTGLFTIENIYAALNTLCDYEYLCETLKKPPVGRSSKTYTWIQ